MGIKVSRGNLAIIRLNLMILKIDLFIDLFSVCF
jgi:hypothetical protein